MKMKRIGLIGITILSVFFISGCLYMKVKGPFDTDLNQTTLGDKIGKAHSQSILWLVAWGDAGTAAAAKEGGITTVNHMDVEVFSILFGLYLRTTTIVYGN